jgi:hypothetical protein
LPTTRTAVVLFTITMLAVGACSGGDEPTEPRTKTNDTTVSAGPTGIGRPANPDSTQGNGSTGSTGSTGSSGTGTTGGGTGTGSDAVRQRDVENPQSPTIPQPEKPEDPNGDDVTGQSGIIDWIMRYAPSGGGTGGGMGDRDDFLAAMEAYDELADANCREALKYARTIMSRRMRSLYSAAARACLALPQNRTDLWAAAQRNFDKLGAAPKLRDCHEVDVHRLTKRLLDRHRAAAVQLLSRNPDNTRAIASSTCPRVAKATPDRGAASGGQPVTLTLAGENVPKRVNVYFGDRKLSRVQVNADGTAVIKAPSRKAAGGKRTVPVQLSTWNGAEDLAFYAYEKPPKA